MKLLECFQPTGLITYDPTIVFKERKAKIIKEIELCTKKKHILEQRWYLNDEKITNLKREYEQEDRKLAKIDGRWKVVEPFKAPKTTKSKTEKMKEFQTLKSLFKRMNKEDKEELLASLKHPN